MQRIEFNDELKLGIPVIDDQHRTLVDLINDLIDMEPDQTDPQTIPRALDALSDYVFVHFQAEEDMMKTVGYPALAEHHQQHAEFVRKVMQFNQQYRQGAENLAVDILVYLRTWLVEHIKGEDPKFVSQFKAHGF